MPSPASRFATLFKEGVYDRAKVLSDWASLTDKQFKARYGADPETAKSVLGERQKGPRTFRERYGKDKRAQRDWMEMPVKKFQEKYLTTAATAEACFGPRTVRPGNWGGKRESKKQEVSAYDRAQALRQAHFDAWEKRKAETEEFNRQQSEIYQYEGEPDNFVRAVK